MCVKYLLQGFLCKQLRFWGRRLVLWECDFIARHNDYYRGYGGEMQVDFENTHIAYGVTPLKANLFENSRFGTSYLEMRCSRIVHLSTDVRRYNSAVILRIKETFLRSAYPYHCRIRIFVFFDKLIDRYPPTVFIYINMKFTQTVKIREKYGYPVIHP